MEDLISRQSVLDIFGDVHPMDYNAMAYLKQIKELPSVQLIRPKGKWIYQEGHFPVMWKCSECRMMWGLHTDYCPVCGAKMETEE